MQERGYSLVELDTELWSDEPTPSASRHGSQDGEITELTKESWEVSFSSSTSSCLVLIVVKRVRVVNMIFFDLISGAADQGPLRKTLQHHQDADDVR